MDNKDITSKDFTHDSASAGTDGVTSGNFDYGVYSGSSAMEYLRQENERKRQEQERAKKSEAELRREEYEKRFAGMSADEIFGMPSPKKKAQPKEDYSDFFNSEAAEKQAKKDERARRQAEENTPHLENMMPGEDEPSSPPPVDDRLAGARAMIDRRLEQEHLIAREDRYYKAVSGHRMSRELRYRANDAVVDMIGQTLGIQNFRDKVNTAAAYIGGATLGGMLMFWLRKFALKSVGLSVVFIVASVTALVGSFIKRRVFDASSFAEAAHLCWKEAILSAAVIVAAVVMIFVYHT